MSYFGTDHVAGAAVGVEPDELPPISVGNPIMDFAINQAPRVVQNYRQQYRVDSPYSLEFELQDAWQASLDALRERTGQTLELPMGMSSFKAYAENTLGKQSTQGEFGDENIAQTVANFRRVNDSIKALKDPSIKSFEQVLQEVMEMRQEVSADTAAINEGGGFQAVIAEFLGAAAGTLSQRDPLTVATLGLGGVGKTIAAKVLAEATLGGVLSAPGAFEGSEIRELLGEAERSPLLEILYGAVGAGGFRGAIEIGGKAIEIRDLGTLDFDDNLMRQMFEVMPDTPRNRAVKDILDADAEMKAANPFGEGEAATERFVLELDETYKLVNGEPVPPKDRVDPFEIAARDEDFAIVREEAPEVWARLEEANAQVEQPTRILRDNPGGDWLVRKQAMADKARNETEEGTGLDARGLRGSTTAQAKVVLPVTSLVNLRGVLGETPAPGQVKYDALEASVAKNGFVQKTPIMLWINHNGEAFIYEGNNRVALAAKNGVEELEVEIQWRNGAEDTPGDFSADAVSSRLVATPEDIARVNKRYEAAYRAVDAERQRLVAERRAIAAAQPTIDNPTFRYDVVEAEAARVAGAGEEIEPNAARLVEAANPKEDDVLELTDIEDDGLIDIGLPERVPADTRIIVTDDNGNPRSMTIREAMDELDEDVRLEEAMTTCAAGGPNVV